jgi:hypothetical protein
VLCQKCFLRLPGSQQLKEGKEEGKGGRKGAGWDGRSPKTKSWLHHCIASIKFIIFDSFALNKLFNSFCCSCYGCELWDLQAAALNDFCVAWRIALRRIWRLPRTSHSRSLLLIANCMSLLDCICRRFISSRILV